MIETAASAAPPDEAPYPHRYYWLKRILLGVALFSVAAVAVWCWWAAAMNARLDALLDTYRARGEPVTVADLERPPVPDEANAAVLFREAFAALQMPDPKYGIRPFFHDPALLLETDNSGQTWYERNLPVLSLIEGALTRGDCDWGIEFRTPVLDTLMFHHVGKQRTLAKMLSAFVRAQACRDRTEALRTAEMLLRFADANHDAARADLEVISASAVDRDVAQTIHALLPILSRDFASNSDLLNLQTRLLSDERRRESRLRGLQFSRFMYVEYISETLSQTGAGALAPGSPLNALLPIVRPVYAAEATFAARWFDRFFAAAAAPSYVDAMRLAPRAPVRARYLDLLAGTGESLLFPAYELAMWTSYQALAERRLAALAIAVRRYEMDFGELPGELNALVPTYIDEIPLDPAGPPAARLRYAYHIGAPRLYSVGRNGRDEGGVNQASNSSRALPDDLIYHVGSKHRPTTLSLGCKVDE